MILSTTISNLDLYICAIDISVLQASFTMDDLKSINWAERGDTTFSILIDDKSSNWLKVSTKVFIASDLFFQLLANYDTFILQN